MPKEACPVQVPIPSWTVVDASWAGLHQDRVSWSAWWWQSQLASGKFSYLACCSWSDNACYACKEKHRSRRSQSSATMLSSGKLPFVPQAQKLEPSHCGKAQAYTQSSCLLAKKESRQHRHKTMQLHGLDCKQTTQETKNKNKSIKQQKNTNYLLTNLTSKITRIARKTMFVID